MKAFNVFLIGLNNKLSLVVKYQKNLRNYLSELPKIILIDSWEWKERTLNVNLWVGPKNPNAGPTFKVKFRRRRI